MALPTPSSPPAPPAQSTATPSSSPRAPPPLPPRLSAAVSIVPLGHRKQTSATTPGGLRQRHLHHRAGNARNHLDQPSIIIYWTALPAAQLNATSSVAGSLIYSPALGTIPAAGTDILTVTFNFTDATDYTGATMSVQLTVAQATPVINWPTPASIVYGTALSGAQLNASAFQANGTTPLPGVFVYNPPAGTELSVGSQELSVTFTPTDTSDFTSVTKTVSLTVTQSTLTVSANNSTRLYGTANPTFTGTCHRRERLRYLHGKLRHLLASVLFPGRSICYRSFRGRNRPFGLQPDPPERNAVGHSGTRHYDDKSELECACRRLERDDDDNRRLYHQWHTDRNRQFLR